MSLLHAGLPARRDSRSVGVMPAGPFPITILRVEHTRFYVQVQQPAC
jgi:hypothetical protein